MTTGGYKICNAVGCNSLTKERYCPEHKREQHQAYNQSRYKDAASSKATRFYKGADWKKVRKVVLQRDAHLCRSCLREGRYKQGNIVHHLIELKDDWSKRLDRDNLETICQDCHNKAHGADRIAGRKDKAGQVVLVLGYDQATRMNWIEQQMDATRDVMVEPERLANAMTSGDGGTESKWDARSLAHNLQASMVHSVLGLQPSTSHPLDQQSTGHQSIAFNSTGSMSLANSFHKLYLSLPQLGDYQMERAMQQNVPIVLIDSSMSVSYQRAKDNGEQVSEQQMERLRDWYRKWKDAKPEQLTVVS